MSNKESGERKEKTFLTPGIELSSEYGDIVV